MPPRDNTGTPRLKRNAVERRDSFSEWGFCLYRTVQCEHSRRAPLSIQVDDWHMRVMYSVVDAGFTGHTAGRAGEHHLRHAAHEQVAGGPAGLVQRQLGRWGRRGDGHAQTSSGSTPIYPLIVLPPLVTSTFLSRPPVSLARSSSRPRSSATSP